MKLHVISCPMGVNSFLLEGPKGNLLIDCGPLKGVEKFASKIEQLTSPPDLIVLTHAHVDHAGGCLFLRQRWGVQVLCPLQEANWLSAGKVHVPAGTLWWSKVLVAAAPHIRLPELPALREFDTYDGAEYDLCGIKLELIHTPGHSPGHHSVLLEEGTLLTGDAVAGSSWREDSPRLSCFGDQLEKMKQSAKLLGQLRPKQCLPCHGKPFSGESLREWSQRL